VRSGIEVVVAVGLAIASPVFRRGRLAYVGGLLAREPELLGV
jgi:hypothetical protein